MNFVMPCNWKLSRNRVYIAGKVSGLPYCDAKVFFMLKKLYLQEQGYDVFCPVDACKPEWNWYRCMIVCIFNLVFRCNKISLLHNWQQSRGARIEYKIAKFLKYKTV